MTEKNDTRVDGQPEHERRPTATNADGNSVVWRIEVFRENGGQYAAEFFSGDERMGGMSEYSPTPVGALANLCMTLIKIEEDESIDRRLASGAVDPQAANAGTPSTRDDESSSEGRA